MKFEDKFEALKVDLFTLPWLVNGSLNDEESSKLQQAVKNSPQLQKELDFLIAMRAQVKEQNNNKANSDLAWQRLSKEIGSQAKPNPKNQFQKVVKRVSSFAAIAATVVLGVYLSNDPIGTQQEGHFSPLSSENPNVNRLELVIRFNENLSQMEINEFLLNNHLELSSGPSSTGLYYLMSTQEQDANKLLVKLNKFDSKIEYVQINE